MLPVCLQSCVQRRAISWRHIFHPNAPVLLPLREVLLHGFLQIGRAGALQQRLCAPGWHGGREGSFFDPRAPDTARDNLPHNTTQHNTTQLHSTTHNDTNTAKQSTTQLQTLQRQPSTKHNSVSQSNAPSRNLKYDRQLAHSLTNFNDTSKMFRNLENIFGVIFIRIVSMRFQQFP